MQSKVVSSAASIEVLRCRIVEFDEYLQQACNFVTYMTGISYGAIVE